MIDPQFVVIAGPNGAGKSTSAPKLLPRALPYINADEIASQLFDDIESRDIAVGRKLLSEWNRVEHEQAGFAIETTPASKSLERRIKRLQSTGYQFHLIYLLLPSVQLAVERVAERVRYGGHDIPEVTIRRRYNQGIRNFFDLYRPIADTWAVHRNHTPGTPELIAMGKTKQEEKIYLAEVWSQFNEQRAKRRLRNAR